MIDNELQRLSDNIKNLIEVTRAPVDIRYDATSVYAQSGQAVAEALASVHTDVLDAYIEDDVLILKSNTDMYTTKVENNILIPS